MHFPGRGNLLRKRARTLDIDEHPRKSKTNEYRNNLFSSLVFSSSICSFLNSNTPILTLTHTDKRDNRLEIQSLLSDWIFLNYEEEEEEVTSDRRDQHKQTDFRDGQSLFDHSLRNIHRAQTRTNSFSS